MAEVVRRFKLERQNVVPLPSRPAAPAPHPVRTVQPNPAPFSGSSVFEDDTEDDMVFESF